MKVKVFKLRFGNVMVLDTEKYVEYYMQVNSSDWTFCYGCKEDFDNITKEDVEVIFDEYYDSVDKSEEVLMEYYNTELSYWDSFKNMSGYCLNDFEGDGYTRKVFNIDDETDIGCIYIEKEYKELFENKGFVNYFLHKVNRGYCNDSKKKALRLISVEEQYLYNNDNLRVNVEFC
jgi:hypothetical protein